MAISITSNSYNVYSSKISDLVSKTLAAGSESSTSGDTLQLSTSSDYLDSLLYNSSGQYSTSLVDYLNTAESGLRDLFSDSDSEDNDSYWNYDSLGGLDISSALQSIADEKSSEIDALIAKTLNKTTSSE